MAINVLIADDYTMFRQALKYSLERNVDIDVVGLASDGFECVTQMMRYNPHIVVLDSRMPNLNGVQVLSVMKQQKMMNKVILLAEDLSDSDMLLKAVNLGCVGVVQKSAELDDLIKAIFTVFSGGHYFDDEVKAIIESKKESAKGQAGGHAKLTKSELKVLTLVAEGRLNKDIASELSISERTVKNHVSSIFKKIEVTDRTQAAVYAIKNNLVHYDMY